MEKSDRRYESSETYWKRKASLFSNLYETWNPLLVPARLFLKHRQERVQKYLPRSSEGKAADIGCGSGEFASMLAARFREVVGLDYSEMMLELAKKRISNPKITFTQADCRKLPLADRSIDFLSALGLLDYVKTPDEAVLEFARVMKKGAKGVLTFPKSPSLFAPLRISQTFRGVLFKIPPIVNVFSEPKVRSLVEKSGFKILEISALWTTMWIIHVERR